MKKLRKTLICIVIIIVAVLVLAAKYDTCGVKPGKYSGGITYFWKTADVKTPGDVQKSRSDYYVFKNRFGRVVVAETIPDEAHYRNELSNAIYEKYGPVITNVRTIRPGIPTHLDFIGTDNGSTTIYDLIARAGMPATELAVPDPMDFIWVTVDGCWYVIRLEMDSPIVRSMSVSYPGIVSSAEEKTFLKKMVIFYLVLAAILSSILVCLLVIPRRIEKRKAKA